MNQAALAKLLAMLTEEPSLRSKGRSSKTSRKGRGRRQDWTAETLAAFQADKRFAGLEIQPKVNILTYGGWETKGRQVIPGASLPAGENPGVKVGPFTLFHISQTAPMGAEELAAKPKAEPVKAAVSQPSAEITEEMIEAFLAKKAAAAALVAEYGM